MCRSKKVRRSHPKPWDFLLLMLQAQPMRCRSCSYRFYRWPWSSSTEGRGFFWRPPKPVVAEPPKLTAFVPKKRAVAAGKR
jgi:hypothetical protein